MAAHPFFRPAFHPRSARPRSPWRRALSLPLWHLLALAWLGLCAAAAASGAAAQTGPSLPDGNAQQVAGGAAHTCAVTTAGGVQCWGWNAHGQLGDGSTTNRSVPVAVPGLQSGVVAVATAVGHSCALTGAGGVQCWGWNFVGELGDGSSTARLVPGPVAGLQSGVAAIALGSRHGCALTAAGAVLCWGMNNMGQLGDGSTSVRRTPQPVPGLESGVAAITAGENHSCALTNAGAVYCWGGNTYGQLGDGTTVEQWRPTAVPALASGVAALAAGDVHTCALTTAGAAYCWGRNTVGTVGDGSTTDRLTPTPVQGLGSGVAALAAGRSQACALTTAGAVYCWGENNTGQLGDGSTVNRATPTPVAGLGSNTVAIALGQQHGCALAAQGSVQCWGFNFLGQLGDGSTTDRATPVPVGRLAGRVAGLASRAYHGCTVDSAGGVQCWGNNSAGQLGDGGLVSRPTPGAVVGLATGVAQVSAGHFHTCALTTAGAVQCWGDNSLGQLGDGSTLSRSTAAPVTGLPGRSIAVAAGAFFTCALDDAGAVWCWGRNASGELGTASNMNYSTPAAVRYLDTAVVAIVGGDEHTCALTTAGGVQCWGGNASGQLGDGTTRTIPVPRQVSGLTSGVVAIAAGQKHTCALMMGGAVRCWGGNGVGQLGDGQRPTDSTTPVTVTGLGGSAVALAAGMNHSCASTSTGATLCWGDNTSGQLGDGSAAASQASPVAVQGLPVATVALAAGQKHTCALSGTGGLLCWGASDSGQLGSGAAGNSPVPRLVAGAQSLAFAPVAGALHAGDIRTLSASASSGLPAQFDTWTPAVCSVASGSLTVAGGVASGLCGVRALQPGGYDANGHQVAPAPARMQLLAVTAAPATEPDAPAIGSATAGNGQATVVFSAPGSDGGAPITGYTATASPGGFSATGAGSPLTVAGLDNGTAYTFTVAARNSVGMGAASAASNAVTPSAPQSISFANPGPQAFGSTLTLGATANSGLPVAFGTSTPGVCTLSGNGTLVFGAVGTCTVLADQPGNAAWQAAPTQAQSFAVDAVVPGAPTIGTATAGNGQAMVSFTAPVSSGGAAITGYTVTANPGGFSAMGSASPLTVTGLANGTAYTFTVAARNSAGASAASAASNSVTPQATQVISFANPGAQAFGTSPLLAATADSGLAVQFMSATPGVCTVSAGGVLVFATTGPCTIHADQGGNAAWQAAPRVSQGFAVNAVVPGAPTIGTATAGNGEATVSFTAPASDGGATITGYTVTSSPGGLSATGAASPVTITGLANGTAYTFTVVARNSAGAGAASAASNSATPLLLSVRGSVPGLAGTATGTLAGGGASCTLVAGSGFGVAPQPAPLGVTLAHGAFVFEATGCAGSVTITLDYPEPLPEGVRFWKYGPESAGAPASHWFGWSGATLSPDRRTVRYTIADNGPGDANPVQGDIRDPFAPGLGGPPVPVPAHHPAGLAALVALLGWWGWRRHPRGR